MLDWRRRLGLTVDYPAPRSSKINPAKHARIADDDIDPAILMLVIIQTNPSCSGIVGAEYSIVPFTIPTYRVPDRYGP